jgi:uncharacterized membrane protein
MRAAFTATICLAAALLAASSGESRADFRVCNQSGAQVKLAFGHSDTRFGWTSRGWWTLPAGACQQVLYGDITRGYYYVYTLDSANRPINVPAEQVGGTFCIKDDNFDLRSSSYMTPQNHIACEANGLKGVKFRVVEVGDGNPNYTFSLVSNPVSVSAAVSAPASPPPALTSSSSPTTAIVQTPVSRPPTPAGTACQRYPNLC